MAQAGEREEADKTEKEMKGRKKTNLNAWVNFKKE